MWGIEYLNKTHFIILVLALSSVQCLAQGPRYGLDFLNMSSFYQQEAKELKNYFANVYLIQKQKKWLSSVAKSRLKSINRESVKETKQFLAKNPLYFIHWPSERNLIKRLIKRIEKQQRK